MTLSDWANNGWLRRHQTRREDIKNLLEIVDRDLVASQEVRSPDWQFNIAYNAVLQLCMILLNAEGYRPENSLAHYRTLQALPLILGSEHFSDADYLETCRSKRNSAGYNAAGNVTASEAAELRSYAPELREKVLAWLRQKHPNLVPV